MNGSSSADAPAATPRRSGRLSRAALSHPILALAVTALCAATAAVAASGALSSGWGGTYSGWGGASPASRGWPVARSAYMRANIGQAMGRALAGRASESVTLAQAEGLAGALPAGASVDRSANTIRFPGATASLAIVASPPSGADMRFRAAGLENPTIEVAPGALVRIHFVNADSDTAHGWLLLDPVVTVGKIVHGPRAFPNAFALLGDPTSVGQPAVTITFRASRSGTYRYECPVPGHAAMGMQGTFVVA